MADVLVNALTQITSPTSTDSFVMVDRTTNEGRIMDASAWRNLNGVVVIPYTISVSAGETTFSKTITSADVADAAYITSDMVCIGAYIPSSSAHVMASDWNVNTSNGSVTISGSITSGGSTAITLYLAKKRT